MLGTLLPKDYTPEEAKIVTATVVEFYRKLPDTTDKFIVCMIYDLNYTVEDTAEALQVRYETVWQRLKKIKEKLKKAYNIKL